MDVRLATIMLVFGAMALLSGGGPSFAAPSVEKVSREECLKQAVTYLSQIPMDAQIEARLEDARAFYYKNVDPSTYQVPKAPESCEKFSVEMKALDTQVPCYFDRTVMVKSEYENALDLLKESEEVRERTEADFACGAARLAGRRLREERFFDAVVGKTE